MHLIWVTFVKNRKKNAIDVIIALQDLFSDACPTPILSALFIQPRVILPQNHEEMNTDCLAYVALTCKRE